VLYACADVAADIGHTNIPSLATHTTQAVETMTSHDVTVPGDHVISADDAATKVIYCRFNKTTHCAFVSLYVVTVGHYYLRKASHIVFVFINLLAVIYD